MTQEQLQQLSDQDFTQLREDIMSEQVRRNRLKEIPEEVASLKTQFEAVGGTTDELIAKLNEITPVDSDTDSQPDSQSIHTQK